MPEPWNPSAEPWEALQEADVRCSYNLSKDGTKRLANALSGMGWVLAPNEGMFPASYARFSARIHELEAENKRLRDETQTAAGYIASLEAGEYESGKRIEFLEAEVERLEGETLAGSPGGGKTGAEIIAEKPAPVSVPVPESDRVRGVLEQAVSELGGFPEMTNAELRDRVADLVEAGLAALDADRAPSPVPEEPEGGEVVEALRKTASWVDMLAAHLDPSLPSVHRDDVERHVAEAREVANRAYELCADSAPVPVEEPEQKPIHEARPDLDLAAQQVKDEYIERALKVYELAVAPAPEIKPGQVWVSKEHGYKTTIERVEGDDIWLVEGDKPTGVDGQPHAVRDAFLAAWDLVSEPTPATPEIKVGQYWAKAGDIGADVWRVVGAFSGVEGERVRLRNVVDSWLSLSGEMLRRDYRLVSDPDPSPAPSLNPEGLLRWLDGEINQLLHDGAMGNLTPAAKRRLEVMQEVRSRLVSEEAENDER